MAEDILPDPLVAMLERLKLTALRDRLDNLLDDAARREMTFRETLGYLLAAEIGHRDERRTRMATGIAKFPFVRTLDGFDFSAQPSLDPGQIRDLATCRWIANGDALLVLGPPGGGKTQVSVATPGFDATGKSQKHWLRRSDRGSDPVPGMPGTGSRCRREPVRVRVRRP